MKAINVQQSIIAGLIDSSIEIFAKGFRLFFTQNGHCLPISELPKKVYAFIRREMYDNKPASAILFKWCDGIEPDMIEQYMFCNYGGFTLKADYDATNKCLNAEKWPCPMRGRCEGEGKVCQPITDGKITRREMQVVMLISNNPAFPYKRIASELKMSENTLRQHTKSIYKKVNIHSKPELVSKGVIAINSIL